MKPSSYQEWRNCIELDCGIKLTPGFIQERIEALTNTADTGTQKFIQLYGLNHYNQVIAWFKQAAVSITQSA